VSGTHATAQDKHPLSNRRKDDKTSHSWQIEYADAKGRNNFHAARLIVSPADNDEAGENMKLNATLYRFTKPVGNPKKYGFDANEPSHKIENMPGIVVGARKNPGSGNWKKGFSDFVFSTTYVSSTNELRLIIVKGSFHPGKNNKKHTEADLPPRADDKITLQIIDRPLASMKSQAVMQDALQLQDNPDAKQIDFQKIIARLAQAMGTSVPCDEAPPADAAVEEPIEPDPMSTMPMEPAPTYFPYVADAP